jgi:hypothetical protein
MIQTLTWFEIALAGAVLLLSVAESVALSMARWRGLTRNRSRLVTHGLVIVGTVVYAWATLGWSKSLESSTYLTSFYLAPTANWPYVVVLAAIAVVASHELITHLRAVRLGLTRNVSRIVSRMVTLLLLVVMAGICQLRWQLYLEHLNRLSDSPPIVESVPLSR